MKQETKNCAIYTRKSTDEGLDADFNTLDAQREACEAYITSQKAEGWKIIKTQYNDGGYSGGSLERPDLQKLLTDIKAGKIQIVVVYMIDRLTRSLMDFARLVEIFDKHGVTFVSVTQSFNTTTSMGRLTLNVLLSFAQFEREVSAERIRDKIAASKKKGMWMGGNPPIGYEAIDKKLIINPDDTETARHIFERYLALGCVTKLKRELDSENVISKERVSKRGNKVGGKPYSRGALYAILQNPIYIGKIRHKNQIYDGNHEAIIQQETWDAVQGKLCRQAAAKRGHKKANGPNLLKGLLFDHENTPYSPDYTKKKDKIYRYYISQNLIQYRDHPKGVMARLPAHEIETVIEKTLRKEIHQFFDFSEGSVGDFIIQNQHTIPASDLVHECITKITIDIDQLTLQINRSKFPGLVEKYLNVNVTGGGEFEIVVPYETRRANKGAIIIKPEGDDPLDLPPKELKRLIQGIVWRDEHFSGMSMKAIAEREGLSKAGVQKIVMSSFDTLLSL